MKHVLAYGTTMFLAGLVVQLQKTSGIHVHSLERLVDVADLFAFDMVLVDLNDVHAADVVELLRARPDLGVAVVNTDNSALTVFAGQVYPVQTVEEVVACLIRAVEACAAVAPDAGTTQDLSKRASAGMPGLSKPSALGS